MRTKIQSYLLRFWAKVMVWESNRLMRKTTRLAGKLAKACEQQAKHNNRIADTETLLRAMVNAVTKDN